MQLPSSPNTPGRPASRRARPPPLARPRAPSGARSADPSRHAPRPTRAARRGHPSESAPPSPARSPAPKGQRASLQDPASAARSVRGWACRRARPRRRAPRGAGWVRRTRQRLQGRAFLSHTGRAPGALSSSLSRTRSAPAPPRPRRALVRTRWRGGALRRPSAGAPLVFDRWSLGAGGRGGGASGPRDAPHAQRDPRHARGGRPPPPPRGPPPAPPPPPSLPYKVDTSRPSLRTNWTRPPRALARP
jgi:hypothetical protein